MEISVEIIALTHLQSSDNLLLPIANQSLFCYMQYLKRVFSKADTYLEQTEKFGPECSFSSQNIMGIACMQRPLQHNAFLTPSCSLQIGFIVLQKRPLIVFKHFQTSLAGLQCLNIISYVKQICCSDKMMNLLIARGKN